MHVISTGSLVVFGPPKVSAGQEALWYASYAGVLWVLVLIILIVRQKNDKSFPVST